MQPLLSGTSISIYSITFISASVLYVLFALVIRRRTLPRTAVLVLIATGIAVRAALLPVHPLGSDDIYRYLWDGRVQSAGIDPYAYAPADTALAYLHTADLPARVNNPSYHTPYFPLTHWIFLLAWKVAGENILGLKVLLFIAECLTLFVLGRALRARAIPLQNILLYALCPLPVFMFALDAHIDGLGLPLFLLGLVLWGGGRRTLSLVLFGLSLAIKPVALVLLPGLFLSVRPWRERAMVIAVPLLVVAVQFVPYLWTSDPFAGIASFGRNWYYNGAAFEALFAVLRDNLSARVICAILLSASLLAVAWQRFSLPVAAYRSVLLLLLLSPVVHPWYICWLAVLVPLTSAWSGISLVALASLTSFTLVEYLTSGHWGIDPWILALEYAPVILLFWVEMRQKDTTFAQI
jgi:hypothetical protein